MGKIRYQDLLTVAVCLGSLVLVSCDNHGDEDWSWEVCQLKPERGGCSNYTVKWFYNETEGRCNMFWYGGCDGNGNRFEDNDECEAQCGSNTKGTENIVISEDDARTPSRDSPSVSTSETCQQPSSQGSRCGEWTIKWFHNANESRCERFWYGGCEGNDNRFDSEEACTSACQHTHEEDVCRLPVVTGRCRAKIQRYYYNSDRRECLEFVYGGCDGNGNRFSTMAECERKCQSAAFGDQQRDCSTSRFGCCPDGVTVARGNNNEGCPKACQATLYGCCDDDITPAQGPNMEGCEVIEISSGDGAACDQSEHGCCPDGVTAAKGPNNEGCDNVVVSAGTNTDDDGDDNVDTDITVDVPAQCKLSNEFGNCETNQIHRPPPVVRWYYSTAESRCLRFWYSGCNGNGNRFKSEKECLTMCQSIVVKETEEPKVVPVCEQPKEIGPCKSAMPRFFYNQETRQCEQFLYGGCRGNNNNFELQSRCEEYCGVRTGTPVSKPGQCPSVQSHMARCRSSCRFDGDCPGGEKCCSDRNRCSKCVAPLGDRVLTTKQVCSLEMDTGPCRANLQRFFYNQLEKRCKEFTYGGCGGNRNNFETQESCESYCRPAEVVPVTAAPAPERRRQPVCEMTPALGPCNRMVTKYFYNISSMQCESFTYGGCLGNHNNFLTYDKCMSYCGLRATAERRDQCRAGKSKGRCRGNFVRWHYDYKTGSCSEFAYSGCQGNGNNFATESECLSVCNDGQVLPVRPTRPIPAPTQAPPTEEDICSLPLNPRPGTACSGSNWYYNKLTGECKEAPNGECNGNRNNFVSKKQCEGYCSKERVCRPLTYSSSIRCMAAIPRWTYNTATGACEAFSYGGCGGSSNNFASKEACSRKCETQVVPAPDEPTVDEICALPEENGNCLAYIRNWRYDSSTGQCVMFIYGGCGGNKNNFASKEECEGFCSRNVVCKKFEEPEVSCLAYNSRWRYDPDSGQCENFIYGGCGGNANNFETFEACESKCLASVEPTKPETDERGNQADHNRPSSWREICQLQAEVGPCGQFVRKWYYNSVSLNCEEFTYGGCLGNHNNFASRIQCMTYCDSSDESAPETTTESPDVYIDTSSGDIPDPDPVTGVDVCNLDSETGPCRANIPSFYYDHKAGECKQFVYGGCQGNENRFRSMEECDNHCSAREVCLLPQKSGICMAYLPRYFFDYRAQTCKEFVYGGCDGNANNFESEEACLRRCDSLIRDRLPEPNKDKDGSCPPKTDFKGLLGACAPQCQYDSDCGGEDKCCHQGCGLRCVPPVEPNKDKDGFCPPKSDWQGLLGACAPQCQYDSDCGSEDKCCHQGCGFRCVSPMSVDPYQMTAPTRVLARPLSEDTIHVTWSDQSLGPDQLIRDGRFYTVRYFSYNLGQYNYKNVTDLRSDINGLQSDIEYNFNIRVNDPPYLSEWSEETTGRTNVLRDNNQSGGPVCEMEKDPGSCSNWTVRWFYNTEISRCDRFWYGGCNEGNANNFMDELECQNMCEKSQPEVVTPRPTQAPQPYDCRRSRFGCCDDRYTPAVDSVGSNCPEYQKRPTEETVVPATPGESVTLDCRHGSNVTWYRDGKLVDSNAQRRIQNDGRLEIFSATIDDDGVYACHVGSYARPTIYRFQVSVRIPIGIIPGTDKIVVKPNHQAFLHCEAYGNPKPTVTWSKEGVQIQSNGRYSTFSNGTLLVRQAEEEDADSYTCMADNGVSQPAQRTIDLQLREMLFARIENDNGRVVEGGRITLSCEGRGYPTPTITWEKMGRTLNTGGNVYISSNGRLVIRDVTLDNSGTYSCIVSNSEEKIETSTSVQVIPRIVPDDTCEDKTSIMKCRLIVTARLCGYTMYSKICCNSCRNFYNGQ